MCWEDWTQSAVYILKNYFEICIRVLWLYLSDIFARILLCSRAKTFFALQSPKTPGYESQTEILSGFDITSVFAAEI